MKFTYVCSLHRTCTNENNKMFIEFISHQQRRTQPMMMTQSFAQYVSVIRCAYIIHIVVSLLFGYRQRGAFEGNCVVSIALEVKLGETDIHALTNGKNKNSQSTGNPHFFQTSTYI